MHEHRSVAEQPGAWRGGSHSVQPIHSGGNGLQRACHTKRLAEAQRTRPRGDSLRGLLIACWSWSFGARRIPLAGGRASLSCRRSMTYHP